MSSDYIRDYKTIKLMIILFSITIFIGIVGMISHKIGQFGGLSIIMLGIGFYAGALWKGFKTMLNGGSEKLIDLYKNGEKNEEFRSLESIYSLIKPISERLPDEIADYRVDMLHNFEKDLVAQEKS